MHRLFILPRAYLKAQKSLVQIIMHFGFMQLAWIVLLLLCLFIDRALRHNSIYPPYLSHILSIIVVLCKDAALIFNVNLKEGENSLASIGIPRKNWMCTYIHNHVCTIALTYKKYI